TGSGSGPTPRRRVEGGDVGVARASSTQGLLRATHPNRGEWQYGAPALGVFNQMRLWPRQGRGGAYCRRQLLANAAMAEPVNRVPVPNSPTRLVGHLAAAPNRKPCVRTGIHHPAAHSPNLESRVCFLSAGLRLRTMAGHVA